MQGLQLHRLAVFVYVHPVGRRNFLPEQTVRLYMNQLLLSLDFMHNNSIFHRDVKPENILVRVRGYCATMK